MTNVLKGKKKTLFIVLEVALLFALLLPVITGILKPQTVDFALQEWHAQSAILEEDGWRIDETLASGEERMLSGPYRFLDKGSYRVRIEYESTEDQTFYPYARFSSIAYIEGGEAILPRNLNCVEYDFTLTEAVEQFELVVDYNGRGELIIRNITITTTPFMALRRLITCAFFLLILHMLLLHPQMEKQKNDLLAILSIALLASLPLFVKGIAHGHDLDFHLLRIEGIAQEISLGNWPARVHSLYLDGHGYPVSVYYGDWLLYVPALLRLAGFPVVFAYKIYVFFINAATAAVSACCFEKMFGQKRTALLAALAYTTAHYRLTDLYVRASVGEYTAMLFLPVIALAVYRMYTERSGIFRHAALLALGMTGVITTHVLTAEMTAVALAICCVILWRQTLRRETIHTYLLAIGLTLMLSLFFLVPFADYYLTVSANINSTVSSTVMKLQGNGAYAGDYFAFFKGVYGSGDVAASGWRMALTPGAALMAALAASVGLWVNRKATPAMKLTTVLAVLMLWMASTLFPWNAIAAHSRIGRLLSQIQFPWRYLGFAVLFLAILLGQLLEKEAHRQWMPGVCLALCLMVPIGFMSSYSDGLGVEFEMVNIYDTVEMNTSTITATEYLRAGSSVEELSNEIRAENAQAELISREGSRMELFCRTGEEAGAVELPLFHYKGYQAVDTEGTKLPITDGANNLIRVELPAGMEDKLVVDFVDPWYWRAAEMISLLTLGTVLFLMKRKKA